MLGIKKTDNGVLFSIFSEHAENIDLCLFSDDEKSETKIAMAKGEKGIWSVEIPNIKEGQKYGYRANGEFNPSQCLFFNPNKLLVDPYAKEISDTLRYWDNEALLAYNNTDSANFVPKSVVKFETDSSSLPYLTKKPSHKLDDVIIYEMNVKGFSALNEDIPEELRGTFLGLAHSSSINRLKELNITQVELLPIMPTCGGKHLKQEFGLSDYWGYNPYNHFAVDPKFGTIEDFKLMINEMHKNGIEVCMDVVYNHTAPDQIISYEGLDALSYQRIIETNGKKERLNSTGCWNSFDVSRKPALDVAYNSMKYFASLGVDAFRLDLAGDLAMDENNQFNKNAPFLKMIKTLKKETGVRIFGEPWNASGIYAKDMMNDDIIEWNDKGKKSYRKFGKGEYHQTGKLAYHIAGKEKPDANFIGVHDGFTLWDLVNYDYPNNYANNENNQDGNKNTDSWASPTEEIALTRAKTMLALAVLSRGVPIINGGDEVLRSQSGNNNAYCQDNKLTWHNWKGFDDKQKDMYLFSRKLMYLRKSVPLFSSAAPLTADEVTWFRPDGKQMEGNDWDCEYARTLAYQLKSKDGKQDYIVIASGNVDGDVEYKLPKATNGKKWSVVFDTSDNKAQDITSVGEYKIKPFGCVVLTSSGESVKENMQLMIRPQAER
ncbi:MAG: alpha-amylase family glycosyl hydrolase [Alphaproteobacteria bacterium]